MTSKPQLALTLDGSYQCSQRKNLQPAVVVALFVRIPVPGRVKTRLAAALGSDKACRFYSAIVADIIANIQAANLPLYLFHDGEVEFDVPEAWRQAALRIVVQQGGDIGERMADSFAQCFAEGVERVVLLGSDIPGLDPRIITSAAQSLEKNPVVVAPAADGGYCLIGCQRGSFTPRIFTEIPWSTDQVLTETMKRCAEEGLQVTLLETLQDIDTIDDLKNYCRHPAPRALATNTYLKAAGFL